MFLGSETALSSLIRWLIVIWVAAITIAYLIENSGYFVHNIRAFLPFLLHFF